MSFDPKTLATPLGAVADAAAMAAPLLAGVSGVAAEILRYVAVAARFGAAIAGAGKHPTTEIERIHAHSDLLLGVESEWSEAARKKFGPKP